jgi:hypothetical protein
LNAQPIHFPVLIFWELTFWSTSPATADSRGFNARP